MKNVRVAAIQFGSGIDQEKNFSKALEMIDKAAVEKPDLMVLPEFVNHASWYADKEHCYQVSLPLDHSFLKNVARKAKEYSSYIVVNVTLQRDNKACTGSSLLFDRQGELRAVSDKQVLMGHENDFLVRATEVTPVVETEIGRIGLYACMDGVIAETPRGLALRGAQILCNSLNSFAVDEASLHVPVRAAENKVWVVAANKVGPLIPEDQLEAASQFTHIPVHFLHGAGESQVVSPDGTVLVKASLANDEVIVADIQPQLADDKKRPDGNDIFAARRPEVYKALAQKPAAIAFSDKARPAKVACYQVEGSGDLAIANFCEDLKSVAQDHDMLVLPELFFMEDLYNLDWQEAVKLSDIAREKIVATLKGSSLHVVTSLMQKSGMDFSHEAVVLSAEGVIHRQAQIHNCARYQDQLKLADALTVAELPFGKVALVVGEDAVIPEVFRLAGLQGAELVAVAGHVQERWEMETGLVERAAENRVCLAFASRPSVVGASLLANLEEDFTLLTPWKERIFDGKINMPKIRLAPRAPSMIADTLHLEQARNKLVSSNTHVLNSRPWDLLDL